MPQMQHTAKSGCEHARALTFEHPATLSVLRLKCILLFCKGPFSSLVQLIELSKT